MQLPIGKWGQSQYQSIIVQSKRIADQDEGILKQEAAQGKNSALIKLGLYHFANKREADAINQWRQAAVKGDERAMSYLAVLCFVKKDFITAKEWTQKLANKGNQGAKEFLNEIEATKAGRDYSIEDKLLREAKANEKAKEMEQVKLEREKARLVKAKEKQIRLAAERKRQEAIKLKMIYDVPVPYLGQMNPRIPPDAKVGVRTIIGRYDRDNNTRSADRYIHTARWTRNGQTIIIEMENGGVTDVYVD